MNVIDIDPYAEGVEAADTNQTIADCPYPPNSKESEEWIAGFESVTLGD